jgi:hypothetical protein
VICKKEINKIIKPMRILLVLLFLIVSQGLFSQYYTRSAGIRGGSFPGLMYRTFLNEEDAIEVTLSRDKNGFRIGAFREYFKPAFIEFSDNMVLGYGFGAHIGYVYTNKYEMYATDYYFDRKKFSPVFGMDGYVGIDYRIREFPLVFGLDVKPYFEFSTIRIFRLNLFDIAFSVRYRF